MWNPQHLPGRQLDLDDLQWNPPDELPDASFNVAQLAKDYLAGCDPVGHPAVGGFNGIQYGIEAGIEICQHMVMIKRRAVKPAAPPQKHLPALNPERCLEDEPQNSEHANQFRALEPSWVAADLIPCSGLGLGWFAHDFYRIRSDTDL